jgi:hypothetical protein
MRLCKYRKSISTGHLKRAKTLKFREVCAAGVNFGLEGFASSCVCLCCPNRQRGVVDICVDRVVLRPLGSFFYETDTSIQDVSLKKIGLEQM